MTSVSTFHPTPLAARPRRISTAAGAADATSQLSLLDEEGPVEFDGVAGAQAIHEAHAVAAGLPSGPASGASAPPAPSATPEDLHPALWRAHQLARRSSEEGTLPSRYLELDSVLPGGGWPGRVLTELLLPHAGVGELRLLAPALATLQQQQRSVMWFDPPAAPCAWALGALGIDVRQLVVVRSRAGVKGRARELLPAADVLWALEQALKSGHLGAVLAWLPARLPADALRRLQLAAQAHDGPAFLLRDAQMRTRPSAAPLRLLLSSAGPDLLQVAVLKRRGPPLAQPLVLELPAVLSAPALARAQPLPSPATTSPTHPAAGPDVRPGLPRSLARSPDTFSGVSR